MKSLISIRTLGRGDLGFGGDAAEKRLLRERMRLDGDFRSEHHQRNGRQRRRTGGVGCVDPVSSERPAAPSERPGGVTGGRTAAAGSAGRR